MATRFLNDSTVNDSVSTCKPRVHGPDCPQEHSAKVNRSSVAIGKRTARKSSRKKQLLLAATLGLLFSPSIGCTMMGGLGNSLRHQEALDDFMVGYRNQAWAAKAWHCRKHRFCNKQFLGDFENGFRAGYEAVAKGGNGCVPAVCPQSYWGWQYQTADGQARMNAWFEAYPLGVQAAEEDGIGHWSQVRTAMPMPASLPPALAATGAAGVATAALSDQSEKVETPRPDTLAAPAKEASSSPTTAAGKTKAGENAKKAADVNPLSDKVETPELSIPAPKAEKIIPQPSTDPFGFD